MARAFQDVTETELAILQVLWDQGPASRRQIADVLYPRGGAAHYATVQKLLERLEAKGHVRHERHQANLVFSATIDREGLISGRLRDVAETLCGGSLTPLFMNLVRAKPLTTRELDELRALIEELRKSKRGKSDRR